MPDSNRSWLSKLGFGVALAASVGVAYYLWNEASFLDSHYQIEADEHAQNYADQARIEANIECDIASLPVEECDEKATKGARPEQRYEYDLEAQRAMAAWTRAMGKAAVIGVAVGILGLGLIFVTFRETRRGANEGFQANEIARRTSKLQLRAYVGFESCEVSVTGDWYFIDATIRNFGQTPTTIIGYLAQFYIFQGPTDLKLSGGSEGGPITLAPNAPTKLHAGMFRAPSVGQGEPIRLIVKLIFAHEDIYKETTTTSVEVHSRVANYSPMPHQSFEFGVYSQSDTMHDPHMLEAFDTTVEDAKARAEGRT